MVIKMALMATVQSNMCRFWRSTLIMSVCHRSLWRHSFVQHFVSSPMQQSQKRGLALSKFNEKSSVPSPKNDVTGNEKEDLERKGGSKASQNRKIFIGNLMMGKNYISEDKLLKYFSNYGKIEALEFFRTKSKPQGFAFIIFHDAKSVQRVLAESHFIDNRNVRVEAAVNKQRRVAHHKRDLTVLVTNIKKHIDRETIANHFSKFGEVDRVILAKGDEDLNSYYVIFSTMSGATKALEEQNQQIAEQSIDSQVMALEKITTVTEQCVGRTNRLAVHSVPDNITVEDLRDYFQQYGDVQCVDFIVQGGMGSQLQQDSNTAFVRFLDKAIVDEIVKTKDHVINGFYVQVSRYRNLHNLAPEKARELRLSVQGFPLDTPLEEVKKYFEETFNIFLNGVFFSKKLFCIVRLSNQADVEKVLTEQKASFHGSPLHFRRLVWKKSIWTGL